MTSSLVRKQGMIFLLIGAALLSNLSWANPTSNQAPLRIVTLAPHLTEWVYSLSLEDNLVAVSDYSDYPESARLLPRVADYQGVDISAIMALQPTLILAWEGGNKPQDIRRLEALGYGVFRAKIDNIDDVASELIRLGQVTGKSNLAKRLANTFRSQLSQLRSMYAQPSPRKVFYYSWTSPLMTIGKQAWPNKLLNVCGAETLFADSPVDYPQVSMQEVLSRQPQIMIAASKQATDELELFWAPHRAFVKAPLVQVNPDVTSRFSLRLINELKSLCKGIN